MLHWIEVKWRPSQLTPLHMSVLTIPNLVNIHQPWQNRVLAESGKAAQNGDFLQMIAIFQGLFTPEDDFIDWVQPLPCFTSFSFTFQLAKCFYRSYQAEDQTSAFN